MAILFLFIISGKVICCRNIGLIIALVTISATFETLALYALIYTLETAKELPESLSIVQVTTIRFVPYAILFAILVLNVIVSIKFFCAITKPID